MLAEILYPSEQAVCERRSMILAGDLWGPCRILLMFVSSCF